MTKFLLIENRVRHPNLCLICWNDSTKRLWNADIFKLSFKWQNKIRSSSIPLVTVFVIILDFDPISQALQNLWYTINYVNIYWESEAFSKWICRQYIVTWNRDCNIVTGTTPQIDFPVPWPSSTILSEILDWWLAVM